MEQRAKLARVPLFEGLQPDAMDDLAARMHISRFAADEAVMQRQDASSDVYILLSGSVTARSYSNDGEEVAFLKIEAPSVFGEFSAIDNLARSTDVRALGDIECGRLSAADFQAFILKHPQLGLNLARHLVSKIRALSERVFEFGAFSVPVRVRRALLRLAAKGTRTPQGVMIRPAPTHYELSVMLSTHREGISREFARLARRGVIISGRQSITILDLEALRHAAKQDDDE